MSTSDLQSSIELLFLEAKNQQQPATAQIANQVEPVLAQSASAALPIEAVAVKSVSAQDGHQAESNLVEAAVSAAIQDSQDQAQTAQAIAQVQQQQQQAPVSAQVQFLKVLQAQAQAAAAPAHEAPKPVHVAPAHQVSHENVAARAASRDSLATPSSPAPVREVAKGPRLMDKGWEDVQRRTFTKWVNTQLHKKKYPPLASLAADFSDGVKLIQLLEIIGDESMGKYYAKPKMRVQMCENMNKALEFIKQRGVSLTNIGAEDLVDKNEKLTLGMIWTIILRFTIADISEAGLTAKEGLLLWCQRKTHGYKNVNVKDFTFSWADGLALCALIHRHRPDLIDFDKLSKSNKHENVALAFDIAEKHLSIPKLLEPEDLADATKPDERSVMTYIAQYFHAFSALDSIEVAGRRVGKFALAVKGTWDMKNDYEKRVGKLLSDMQQMVRSWETSTFDGTYADAKSQSDGLLNYKNVTKREWVSEKRGLDTLLSNIITKLKTYNLASYTPPAGLGLDDLNKAWVSLVSSETSRRKLVNEIVAKAKDQLRRDYSELANAFVSDINNLSAALGALDGDLQIQLQTVQQLTNTLGQLNVRLEGPIKASDEQCEKAHIGETEREYTVYSVDDLAFDLGLVKVALQTKKSFIENQVVARNMTNLTPQQLEEFESTFKAFDKDNSNKLSKLEFKACMASLGKAYDDAQFEEVFKKAAGGETEEFVDFEKFTKYMVSITEDKVTPDQLRQSFQAISKGKDHITEMDLRIGQVAPEQVEYLKSVMPPKAGVPDAYDFEKYLATCF